MLNEQTHSINNHKINTKGKDLLQERAPSSPSSPLAFLWEYNYKSAFGEQMIIRREWQCKRSRIPTVCNLHILSVISRNTSLHIDQITGRINLLHLPISLCFSFLFFSFFLNTFSYQQVLDSAILVSHASRHFLSLERLSRILFINFLPSPTFQSLFKVKVKVN